MQTKLKTVARTFVLTAILVSSASIWAASGSGKYIVNVGEKGGETDFTAIGRPSALQIHGKGDPAKGTLTVDGKQVTGKITFPLASLDTGISMRNTHMKEKYLETSKYPDATLEITKMSLPPQLPPGNFKLDKVPFEGPLTIKGVSKPIQGTANLVREGDDIKIEASFDVKISDWPIGVPSFSGVTVANDVQVVAKADSKIEPAAKS